MTCLPFSSATDYSFRRSVLQWRRRRLVDRERSESRPGGSVLAEVVPEDVLALVFRRLNLDDFLRFGAVCRRLQGISTNYSPDFTTKFFPWLVIQEPLGRYAVFSCVPNHSTRTIHDLVKIRDIDPKFECYGSSHGWLIVVEFKRPRNSWWLWPRKNTMRLLNPVSGQQLSLPDFGWPDLRQSFPYSCKFVLSSYPSSSSATSAGTCFIVAAPFGHHYPIAMGNNFPLAFARVDRDDHEWTRIKYNRFCDDIIFFKDKLYGISQQFGTIIRVEGMDEAAAAGRSAARVREIVTLRGDEYHPAGLCSYYLAQSQGNLLVVERVTNQGRLHIYRLIFNNGNGRRCSTKKPVTSWSRVYSLNDQVLFIGKNSCISLPASSNSRLKNCVYLSVDGNLTAGRYTEIEVISTEEGISTVPLDDGEIPAPFLPILSRHRRMGHEPEYHFLTQITSYGGMLFMPFWLTPTM